MSRYSRIFLRSPKGTGHSSSSPTAESTTIEPQSVTTPGFSYPPSSSHHTGSPMNSPPHPYTLGASYSPTTDFSMREAPSTAGHTQHNTEASEFSAEKPPQNTRTQSLRRLTSLREKPSSLPSRPFRLLLMFLPIPPLLSLIYMAVGHAILRATHPQPQSVFRAPVLSSVEAGATGGVILSLPLALLLFILLSPNPPPSNSRDDFFEDDDSTTDMQARWIRYTGYTVFVLFVFAIGGVAGPLGVTCLSSGTLDAFVDNKRMLSTGAAAAAGFLGGVILSFGTLAITVALFFAWTFWMRYANS
ncbi:hypothetical protein M413DRAFT_379401 [Hebeloma cylindrosporum]|uniref:Uncharacterized protein n=1 Tax=Hebeloma cylindrosporum TaxID=76867 RepID=A0A0C2Y3B6_HEBCY|nr:hypothetical protein M413DRAFT_379401 [Hebeloma cylindrosporum h7]